MKKKFLFSLAASLFALPGFAQLQSLQTSIQTAPNPTTLNELQKSDVLWWPLAETNFKVSDINDKEYDMGKLLKEGKFIFIDISAVWCGPCWSFHQSGALETLYKKYGSEGSKEIEIFWVEGDPSNDAYDKDEIRGKRGKGSARGTQGDWTHDGKVPYPIFVGADGTNLIKKFDIAYLAYPTFLVVSPLNYYTIISGGRTADALWVAIKKVIDEHKKIITSGPVFTKINYPSQLYAGEDATFTIDYKSFGDCKLSYEYNGQKADIKDNTFTLKNLATGKHEVKIMATDSKTTTTETQTITVSELAGTTIPQSYSFDDGMVPVKWLATKASKNGYGWVSINDYTTHNIKNFASLFKDPLLAYNKGGDALVSFSGLLPTLCGNTSNGVGFGGTEQKDYDDYLISEAFNIPSDASKPGLTFHYSRFFEDSTPDMIQVLVSPTGKRGITDFTDTVAEFVSSQSTGNKNNPWHFGTISLEKYKGKSISIAIRHLKKEGTTLSKAGVRIDEVKVIKDNYLAVNVPEMNNIELFPTRATEQATLVAPKGSQVTIFNVNGKQVANFTQQTENQQIQVAGYARGTYFVRVSSQQGNFRILTLIVK